MSLSDRLARQIAYMECPRGNFWDIEGARAIVDTVILPELREMYGAGFLTMEEAVSEWDAYEASGADLGSGVGENVQPVSPSGEASESAPTPASGLPASSQGTDA